MLQTRNVQRRSEIPLSVDVCGGWPRPPPPGSPTDRVAARRADRLGAIPGTSCPTCEHRWACVFAVLWDFVAHARWCVGADPPPPGAEQRLEVGRRGREGVLKARHPLSNRHSEPSLLPIFPRSAKPHAKSYAAPSLISRWAFARRPSSWCFGARKVVSV